ncbi:hypothetical protein [Phytohabitans suffuscus]|nr:hypothetical protein [Phytohabitans suffuscus]
MRHRSLLPEAERATRAREWRRADAAGTPRTVVAGTIWARSVGV